MMNILSPQILLTVVFLTLVFLHLARKNSGVLTAYGLQSLAIVLLLFASLAETHSLSLLLVALFTLLVKVILAPLFFGRLIARHRLTFSASTYLNTPLTLIIISVLTATAYSQKLLPLTSIIPDHQALLALAFSSLLLSLFLIVNRKGALSQIVGILSLENSIVAFVIFSGLEQSPSLQLGIIFDIFVWLIIATVFVSMVYRHFSSLDVTAMKNLKD